MNSDFDAKLKFLKVLNKIRLHCECLSSGSGKLLAIFLLYQADQYHRILR